MGSDIQWMIDNHGYNPAGDYGGASRRSTCDGYESHHIHEMVEETIGWSRLIQAFKRDRLEDGDESYTPRVRKAIITIYKSAMRKKAQREIYDAELAKLNPDDWS